MSRTARALLLALGLLVLAGAGFGIGFAVAPGPKSAEKAIGTTGTGTTTTTTGTGTGTTAQVPSSLLTAHPCSAQDFYMQCAILQPNTLLPPPPRAPGPVGQGALAGLDFAWGGPSGSFAKARGVSFSCSYLSGSSKDWSYSLLRSYKNAGIHACFVWETSQYRPLSGYNAGYSDARYAAGELSRLGAAGASVFFAYDFDTSGRSCTSVCPYLRGADAAIGKARVGVYGGIATVRTAFSNGVVTKAWQTLAWSYGQWDPRACLRQVTINNVWYGYSVDHDTQVCANNGLWPSAPARAICFGRRATGSATCRRVHAEVRVLQANEKKWAHGAVVNGRIYKSRGCPVLAQRITWFSAQLKAHPHRRTASRKRALAASRKAWRQKHCYRFGHLDRYFSGKAAHARAELAHLIKTYS